MKKVISFGAVYAFISIIGSLASILSGLGFIGLFIVIILAIILFITSWLFLKPILTKNNRGITLYDSIKSIGLEDIENREEEENALPPYAFYERANTEIIITGITCFRTVHQNVDFLKKRLRENIKIYLLILHPDSEEVNRLSSVENFDIKQEILRTIEIIANEKLLEDEGFHLKFFRKSPPFTAVMIDGDVECPDNKPPKDVGGHIRVQPSTSRLQNIGGTQHRGLIMQFNKKNKGAFEYFSADLRNQWRAAKDGKKIITKDYSTKK